jgi:hypothetical protein
MAEIRIAKCVIWVGMSKGKIPVGRNRHRWEDNVKMDLMEISCVDVDWIYLYEAWDQW